MSYEILNKTSNGFDDEDPAETDEDPAETEDVDIEGTNEELKASIENLIFKRHITLKDRHVQKLNSELFSSIQRDDLETFVRCLQEGANPSAICRETGLSACHVAVLCERCHLLEKLLKAGGSDSFPSWHNGYLPIHVAAWKECLNCLKMLVNNTRSNTSVVNSTNQCDISLISQSVLDSWHHHHKVLNSEMPPAYEKCTPLHIVCKKLNFRCAEYLLEEKADTEAVDGRGMTPLDVVYEVIMAANTSDRSVYNESFKKSATDLARSRTSSATTFHDFNRRQLHDFIEIKMESDDASKIISSLIDYDSKFKAATSISGNLAIMEKCKSFLFPATITQNEKLLKILLAKNVDLSTRNENGDTVLHFAVRHRLKRSLFILLKSEKIKSILETRDTEFKTPLHIAVSCMWIDGTSALLESGANVTAATNDGDTTLHCAARTTNTCIMDGLFTYPETETIKDYKNENEETAIMVAVMYNNVDCVRKLINFGVCLRLSSRHNRTLVHVAAENGFSRILKLVLREDCDLKEAKTDDNETALHLAAKGGHQDCLQHLLSIGCCETAITITVSSSFDENFDFGGTALHYAAWKGHLPIIQALVDCNKDLVNVANVNKWFPLHVAMYFNHADCADFLIKHGANLSYRVPYADGTLRSSFDILSYTFTDPSLFLERVFDCYIEKNDLPLTHMDSCISLKFDSLTPNGSGRKQMKVLSALLNNENEPFQRQVLLHPLIETFLYLKWKKLRPFFNFTTLLYAFFIVTLTLFALYVDEPASTITNVVLVLMLTSLIPLSVLEVLHARKLQRYYVKDLESWLKWFTYGMTLFVGSRAAYLAIFGYSHSRWNDIIVVPLLFAWIEALFLLSRYPTWGFCILMFFQVSFHVVKVFCTFSPLILGFVFSFYIFFKYEADSPFYTLQEAFVRTIAMVSEFEYSGTFHKSDSLLRDVIARFLFLTFVVLMAIVLVNLMVGMAVSDVATLQAQGRSKTLAKQIDFLYMLESLVYNENLLDLLPHNVKAWVTEHRNIPSLYFIYPNRPFDKKTTELPAELKRMILSKVSSKNEPKYGVSRNRVEIAKKLQLFSQELDLIHRELSNMESGSILPAP